VKWNQNQARDLNTALSKRWLATVRAYLWKEKFQRFWEHECPQGGAAYLLRWCKGALRSRLAPLKKFVRTMRANQDLSINWFEARNLYSIGAVEGMNRRINLITRKSCGYRSYEVLRIALFHTLGGLPEPKSTHRF